MGWALCYGRCVSCDGVFCFNPLHVPSVRIHGTREPICEACITRVNDARMEKGIAVIVVHEEAYTSCKEEEL